MSKMGFISIAAAALLGAFGSAQAQTSLEAELLRCGNASSDEARLSCYDELVEGLAERRAQREVRQRELVETTRERAEQDFGLAKSDRRSAPGAAPEIPAETREVITAARPPDTVTAKVREVRASRDGKPVVTLDNGQIWVATQATWNRKKIPDGVAATIKKSAHGGYRMRFDGVYGYMRVRRLQ